MRPLWSPISAAQIGVEQSFGCSPAVGIRLGLGSGLLSPKGDYSSRNANEVNSFCRIGYWCLPCGYTEGRSLLLTSLSSTDLTELHKGENYPHFCDNNSKVRLKSWFNLRSLFRTARVHKHIISQILNVSGAENTFRRKKKVLSFPNSFNLFVRKDNKMGQKANGLG